jgi:hypothetical protein
LLRERILVRARAFESIRLLIHLLLLNLFGKVFSPLKPCACIPRIPDTHRLLAIEAHDMGWVIEGSAHLGLRIPLSDIGSDCGGGSSSSRVE